MVTNFCLPNASLSSCARRIYFQGVKIIFFKFVLGYSRGELYLKYLKMYFYKDSVYYVPILTYACEVTGFSNGMINEMYICFLF